MRLTDFQLGGWREEPVSWEPRSLEDWERRRATQAIEAQHTAIEAKIRDLQFRAFGMCDAAALQRRNDRIEELQAQKAALPPRAAIYQYVEPVERDRHQDGTSYNPWAPDR